MRETVKLVAAVVTGSVLTAGILTVPQLATDRSPQERGPRSAPVVPVTPDVPDLASELDGNTRRFEVTAREFTQQLATFPYQTAQVWGYDDDLSEAGPSTPGPTAIVYEGEQVEFTVNNDLAEPTTVHFHGLHAPNDADGVAGISQPEPIQPGESYTYRFTPGHTGNFAYHSHTSDAVQELKGLDGSFQVLPRQVRGKERVDQDFVFTLQSWSLQGEGQPVEPFPEDAGDFNFQTINGKTLDAASELPVRVGDKIRARVYNASQQVHAMHLHGVDMTIVSKNGHPQPAQTVTTFNISPGDFVEVEFSFDKPGKWIFHCHFPHHTSNAMQDGPNGSPVGMGRVFVAS
ncbi:multicopper oxidase family protein [Cellulomonas fimi]|uniref:multicopper oxidase family protein n=1 Tax=Cellulomonas fimi TaxID=1708 RepID=UPI001B87B5C2|nr:multicopper oxidase domain-containing protein [Cellulomonas fimi]